MIATNGTTTLLAQYPDFDLYQVEVRGYRYTTCENKIKATVQVQPESSNNYRNYVPTTNSNKFDRMVEYKGNEITLTKACELACINKRKATRLMNDFNLLFEQALEMDRIERETPYINAVSVRRKYQIHQRVFDRLVVNGLPGNVYGTQNKVRYNEDEILKWANENGYAHYFKVSVD